MTASLRLSWREGVTLETLNKNSWRIQGRGCRLVLPPPHPAVAEAIGRLAPPGEDEDRLAGSVLEASGPGGLAGWYFLLQRCARRSLLYRALDEDGRRLATLLPAGSDFPVAAPPAPSDRPVRLSRFAYLRRDEDRLVLESPQARASVVLDDASAAAVVCALARPGTASELAARGTELSVGAVTRLLGLLIVAGMVQQIGTDGNEVEPESPALECWEFHDRLFHARSRKGRTEAPFGATYRMAHRMESPPSLKPVPSGATIPLDRPEMERLERDDPSLSTVLERRRSIRDYGTRPITAEQLGEFLFRVARVKATREFTAETPRGRMPMEVASRPYPAGGALYELEFYLAVQSCEGVDPGLYYYDPRQHQLVRIRGLTADVERLLHDAAASASIPAERIQVVIILASRFPRLAWKYASIAYALTLKHVGVAFQTMYLVATAMDLAPCALGGGDSDYFARAAGTDHNAETSVGEFLIASQYRPGESQSEREILLSD